MSFRDIALFSAEWAYRSRRRLSLSFALMEDNPVDIASLRDVFDPTLVAIRLALYIPSSRATASRHPTSAPARIGRLAAEAQTLGYRTIVSPAGPIERVWDARPYSAFRMLCGTVGTSLE